MNNKVDIDKVFGEILQLKLARKYIPASVFAEKAKLELGVVINILNGSEKVTNHILFKDLDILLGCTPGHFSDVYKNITEPGLSQVKLKPSLFGTQPPSCDQSNKDLPPTPVETEESILVPADLLLGLADAAHEGGYLIAGDAYAILAEHKRKGKES